ncbi:MAG: hypothetical protein LBN43_08490 [Oscillospiraceae bacterium]|jgi:5-hydroxyisourate hydrolase-like protein (transthyretin family)|nr:hypothetical protein [Oscillospiraceae bacterium]
MKRIISLILIVSLLVSIFAISVYADPLDENGDTGGTGPGGTGSMSELWDNPWQGMRITIIDVSDPSRMIGGEQWGKVAAGTVSVDITNITTSSGFFTRTMAADGSTALSYGNKVTHFGKVSKMAYRDGEAIASTNNGYTFQTVNGMPALMGSGQASAQTIKDYINNEAMLTSIANWCGISSYAELVSGKYKILAEPVMYALIGTTKYAFTPTEAAMFKPHGNQTGWPLINNTLANAFFLERDELGWDKWTGSTSINQPFQTIIDSLGMHIYSIAPETPPPSDPPPPPPEKGKIKIIKKDEGTNASLSGATFSVKKGGSAVGSFTTNSSGEVTTGDLDFGEYTVSEITAPSGYELNSAPQTVNLTVGGATVSVTFTNKKIPPPPPSSPPAADVDFQKVEYGTELGLPGAMFRVVQLSHWESRLIDPNDNDLGEYNDVMEHITNGDDIDEVVHEIFDNGDDVWTWLEIHKTAIVGTFVSGSDGSIPVGALEAGSYTIEEITPPAGYALTDNVSERIQSFDVPREGGYTVKIVFGNKKLPGLTVLKVDEDTGLPLAGAEFSIKHNGNIIYEGVTDASGIINQSSLSEGWYEVTELAAPHGYLMTTEKKSVYLEAGGSAQLKFDNRRKPTLKIEKRDAQTMQPLAGAKFRVNETEGGTVGEYTTGADGTVTIENLDDVIYSVEEIAAPNGYLLDPQHKDIKLEWGKVQTLVFTDHKKPGLTITKTDEATGKPLANAHFRVESLDGNGYFYEGATGANGQIHLDNLPEGVYEITETAAPDGYIIANHPKLVQLIGDSVVNVMFTNRAKPALTIVKLDEGTKQPLAGAKFKVQKTESNTVSEYVTGADGTITIPNLDEAVYNVTEIIPPVGYVLDENNHTDIRLEWGKTSTVVFENLRKPGLLITKVDADTGVPVGIATLRVAIVGGFDFTEVTTDESGSVFMEDLLPGTYEISEVTAPEGYILDAPTQTVILKAGENTTVLMPDHKKPTLTIFKYDELTNLPLAGASFKLWKTEGETWSETQITGDDGTYTWTGLDEGIYSIQEIDEPYGYFKDSTRKEILLNGGDNKQLVFFNRPRPVLTILKRDAITGLPIKDVKFKVQRLEGETIGEFLTDSSGKIELSPATGYLLTEEIYRVTELVPPNEYLLDTNNVKDVKLKWYEPTELFFENILKPTLIFIKRDGMSGRGIDNATYRVDYEAPTGGVTSLGTYKTKCGLIVLPYVLPGWYSLTEVFPAPGYSLPTNPVQRLHLAPGENSYTYTQTHEDLYVDPRTNPNSGTRGMCDDWCGYLCSQLCANCGGTIFSGITITNGKGEALGTVTTPSANPTIPTVTVGAVTRNSNLTATVQFTSSAAGKYYYSIVNDGANAPTIGTGGVGTNCVAGLNTITVYTTSGAKDLYIKVKDVSGNVSNALKIDIPAYSAPVLETPETSATPAPSSTGAIVYINPEFSTIKITFGNNY